MLVFAEGFVAAEPRGARQQTVIRPPSRGIDSCRLRAGSDVSLIVGGMSGSGLGQGDLIRRGSVRHRRPIGHG